MKLELATGTVLIAVALTAAEAAAVNCAQVNRYLATGRTTQDVAETMVVAEEDVKKCQAEAATTAPGGMAGTGSKPAVPAAAPAADGK